MPDCVKDIIKGTEIYLEGTLSHQVFGSLWWVIFTRGMQTIWGYCCFQKLKKNAGLLSATTSISLEVGINLPIY